MDIDLQYIIVLLTFALKMSNLGKLEIQEMFDILENVNY